MPRQFYVLLSLVCFDLEIFCCLTDGFWMPQVSCQVVQPGMPQQQAAGLPPTSR